MEVVLQLVSSIQKKEKAKQEKAEEQQEMIDEI